MSALQDMIAIPSSVPFIKVMHPLKASHGSILDGNTGGTGRESLKPHIPAA